MFTAPIGFLKQEAGGIPFNLYNHTWNGNANIQSNEAELDGTGDDITPDQVSDIENAFIGSGDFTFEMDIDTDVNRFQTFFGVGNGGAGWSNSPITNGHLIILIEVGGNLEIEWESNNLRSLNGAASMIGGKRVMFLRDSGRISLYLDGTRLNTVTSNTTITKLATTGTPAWRIGGTAANDTTIDGSIGNIRLSNIARYDATLSSITDLSLINDIDTVYLNTFTGANGTTPTLNTE